MRVKWGIVELKQGRGRKKVTQFAHNSYSSGQRGLNQCNVRFKMELIIEYHSEILIRVRAGHCGVIIH